MMTCSGAFVLSDSDFNNHYPLNMTWVVCYADLRILRSKTTENHRLSLHYEPAYDKGMKCPSKRRADSIVY